MVEKNPPKLLDLDEVREKRDPMWMIVWICLSCLREIIVIDIIGWIKMVKVVWTVDNEGKLFVDGKKVDESSDWRKARKVDLEKPPTNVRVEALNRGGPGCVWLYVTRNGEVIEKTDRSWSWNGEPVYVEKDKGFIQETWSPVASTFLDKGVHPIWVSRTGLREGTRQGQWITFKWSKPLLEKPMVKAGLGVVGAIIAAGFVGSQLNWW